MVEVEAHLQEVEEAAAGLSTMATEDEREPQLVVKEGEEALGKLAMEVVEEPHSKVEAGAGAEAGLLGLQ